MSNDFTRFESNILGALADLEEEASRISPLDFDTLTAYNFGKTIGSAQRALMLAGWEKVDGVWEWDEDDDDDDDDDFTPLDFSGCDEEEAVVDTASPPTTTPVKENVDNLLGDNPDCLFGQKDCDCRILSTLIDDGGLDIDDGALEEYLNTNPLD